ncbi:hypothetical protein UlMin_026370 [Ulmus minor]
MAENSSIQNITGKLDTCVEIPPLVNSHGFWSTVKNDGFVKNSLPDLELHMAVVFCISQALHFVLKRLGLPKLASEILTGLLLGYALVDSEGNPNDEKLLTVAGQQIIGTLSLFGYVLFLFISAVKVNINMIPNSGTKSTIIGVACFFVPFVCGTVANIFIGHNLIPSEKDTLQTVVLLQSLVSFPVISTLINELNILNSELGRLGLSAAMVSDIISFALANLFLILKIYNLSPTRALIDLVVLLVYTGFVVFVLRPAMLWIINQTPEGMPVKDYYVYAVILAALGSGLLCNKFDAQVFFGPYIFGMAVPDGPPLGSAVVGKLECFVSGLFLPLFVTVSILRVDLTKNRLNDLFKCNMILFVVTYVAKLVASLLSSFYYEMPMLDSWVLAFIMTSKGTIEIALYTYVRDINIFTQETFNLMMLGNLVVVIIVPLFVKCLYDPSRKYAGYQKRNIMHLKPNSELRVLACIHGPDDIPAVINILDAACPTQENPIVVSVLHLIELIGRTTPIFIAHQKNKKSLSHVSYSEHVIISFNRFESNNWGTATVNCFTAVSPHKFMHEDICTLALDKLTSLIILPFHQTWSNDGNVEVEDNMVRALNKSVLERAPCSVGILVNRGYSGRAGTRATLEGYLYSVCMVFLGGKDDREALTYAKRMCQDSNITLSVFHFVDPTFHQVDEEDKDPRWDQMLDSEVLKDIRHTSMSGKKHVAYAEEIVNDGSQMATMVRSLVDEYDLIIAGRSHREGFFQRLGLHLEWSEFPELGVIGDLLASAETYGKASVLVMQQQTTDNGDF